MPVVQNPIIAAVYESLQHKALTCMDRLLLLPPSERPPIHSFVLDQKEKEPSYRIKGAARAHGMRSTLGAGVDLLLASMKATDLVCKCRSTKASQVN